MTAAAERTALGEASRRLLTYAWSTDRDPYLIGSAIRAVVKTFDTAPEASEAVLRNVIEREHLARFGYEELLALFDNPGVFIELAPRFLTDCYAAVFAYRDDSDDRTMMLPSQLLGLSSTRKQDYRGAWHRLEECFPAFLERAPAHALDALLSVCESYARDRAGGGEVQVVRFIWRGRRNEVVEDGSHIWDAPGTVQVDPQEQIVGHFERHVAALLGSNDELRIEALVQLLAGRRLPAVIWARVLQQAAANPDASGSHFADLLSRTGLLALSDLRFPIGSYLSAVFADLPVDDRRRIEDAVCALPRQWPADRSEIGERARDTYLSVLSVESLVTERAQRRKQQLESAADAPQLGPLFSLEVGWGDAYSTEDALTDRGADVGLAANRQVIDELAPLSEVVQQYFNTGPPRAEVAPAVRRMKRLLRALLTDVYAAAEEPVLSEAWTTLAQTGYVLARHAAELTAAQGATVRSVFLAAVEQPHPASDIGADEFDVHEHWTASARNEAACGLPLLMRDARFVDEATRAALEDLANDSAPNVRYQVARRIAALSVTARDVCWAAAERWATHESSGSVLVALARELGPLMHQDPTEALKLAQVILRRERRRKEPRTKVLIAAADLIIGHHLWHGSAAGSRLIPRMAGDLKSWYEPIRHVLHAFRPALIVGAVDSAAASERAVRERALSMMRRFLDASLATASELRERHRAASGPWPDEDLEAIRAAIEVAQAVADQLYFASGVFQQNHPVGRQDHADPQQRIRLYGEARDLLETVTQIGHPRAVHHVIEFVEGCIDADPRGVFLLIADAVRGGADWGYQLESMAQALIVRVVRRYLAEQRQLFQDDDELETALADILDVFVAAGWPDARRLVYGIGDLFR